jgi:hypothetical protein
MANVLNNEKRQQVVALGRLGWPLGRIEEATGVRRETASVHLKAAGIAVLPPGGWCRLPLRLPDGTRAHDFRTLVEDLSTMMTHGVERGPLDPELSRITTPAPRLTLP